MTKQSHPLMQRNEICYDECTTYHTEIFPDGITNGAAWYPLYGGMQDWLYENTNDIDVTIEVGCNQYPPASSLPQYWALNKRALLSYMQQVHRGIKGVVRDSTNKAPLANVLVHVSGRQHNISTSFHGDYYRILLPGFYDILFEKSGYKTEKVFATITDGMPVILDIELQPDGTTTNNKQPPSGSIDADLEQINNDNSLNINNEQQQGEHSIVLATLIMTVIIALILLAMSGAYVIQKRRFQRSQSVSMELQAPRSTSASTGISLQVPGNNQKSSTASTTISPTHLAP